MPLDFADFAHHYEGHGVELGRQRAHFEAVADLLDCITRLFWQDNSQGKRLGITLQSGTLQIGDSVNSGNSITTQFNDAASGPGAGKQEI